MNNYKKSANLISKDKAFFIVVLFSIIILF